MFSERNTTERRWISRIWRHRRVKAGVMAGAVLCAGAFIMLAYVSLFSGDEPAAAKSKHGSSKKAASVVKSEAEPGTSDSSRGYPASILNLTNWKLTLPNEASDDDVGPQEVEQPELATFVSVPYFMVNAQKNGIQFQAPVNGVTTKGSNYPRSELREMTDDGTKEASWSDTSGTHTMTIREAITHLPVAKPQLVAGQIHDESDDIVMVRLEGSKLFIEANGDSVGTLDNAYRLGTTFTVQIVATGGHIMVSYNGVQKVDYRKSGSGWYFKAGCYTQSNLSKGDNASAYGQVVIYGLQVSHT